MTSSGVNLAIVGLLILMVLSVLTVAGLIFFFVLQTRSHRPERKDRSTSEETKLRSLGSATDALSHWLVIPSTNLDAVREALGLSQPIRCSWGEGIARQSDHSLFIAEPFQGWTLVVGRGLPDPLDDPDLSFHFMVRLSKEFGEAQFFTWNRALGHHGWVRASHGRIIRGYCWAGETVWNQGAVTEAEKRLGIESVGYGQKPTEQTNWSEERPPGNMDLVPPLAAAWSFDPNSAEAAELWESGWVMGELIPSRSR